MARVHVGRDNWFLVIPAAILGLVTLYTVNRMYRAGDIRRSIEVVASYQVEGRPSLQDYLRDREGALGCEAEILSYFYGTLDVTCMPEESRKKYTWRVHVGQRAFAPGDAVTLGLMREYAPSIFNSEGGNDDVDH